MSDSLAQFISESLLTEKVISGWHLDSFTNELKRRIITAICSNEVQQSFKKMGHVEFDVEAPENNSFSNITHAYVTLGSIDSGYSILAQYNYLKDETVPREELANIDIEIEIPQPFNPKILNLLGGELVDAIRHELEHSSQSSELLATSEIKKGPYSSLEEFESYLLSPAEIAAYTTGYMKKAKYYRADFVDTMKLELDAMLNSAIAAGLPKKGAQKIIRKAETQILSAAMKRYPQAF